MLEWARWIMESAHPMPPEIKVGFVRTSDLVTIGTICALSLLASLLWLVALGQYVWSKSRYPR